jgi:hypothetical protein
MSNGMVVQHLESWVKTFSVFHIKTNIVFIIETVVLAALSLLFNLRNTTGCLLLTHSLQKMTLVDLSIYVLICQR